MATQRNVLIVGGYARQNAGDAALLHAIILQVERAFPGCLVEIAGMEDPRLHRDFEGVQNLGSMRRYADEEGIPRFRPCRPQGPCPCHRNVMVRRACPLVPLAVRLASGRSTGGAGGDRAGRPARLAGGRGRVPARSCPAGSWPTGHLPAPAADAGAAARHAGRVRATVLRPVRRRGCRRGSWRRRSAGRAWSWPAKTSASRN